MTSVRRIILSSVAVLTFAAATWALPPSTADGKTQLSVAREQAPSETKSVSGKISSVQKDVGAPYVDSFTVDVAEKTFIFFTYKGTMMEGELKTGANAEVSYAMDKNGNLVALTVHITP